MFNLKSADEFRVHQKLTINESYIELLNNQINLKLIYKILLKV